MSTSAMVTESDGGKLVSTQGKLIIESGKPTVLSSNGRDIRLTSRDESIVATFGDPRISGREMKLEGRFLPDGTFEVRQFYVVRANSLYRLIYFCDT